MAQILKSRNLAPSKVYTVANPGTASVKAAIKQTFDPSSIMSKLKSPTQSMAMKSSLSCPGRKRPTQY